MQRIPVLIGLVCGVALAGCGHHALSSAAVNTNLVQKAAPSVTQPATALKHTETGAPAFRWTDVHFAFDEASLNQEARSILAAGGAHLAKNSNHVEIQGNCDERGSVEYNLALGERRARSCKEYLVDYGIQAARITTVSFGKERPLDPGHDEEAWARNRRAHFVEQRANS